MVCLTGARFRPPRQHEVSAFPRSPTAIFVSCETVAAPAHVARRWPTDRGSFHGADRFWSPKARATSLAWSEGCRGAPRRERSRRKWVVRSNGRIGITPKYQMLPLPPRAPCHTLISPLDTARIRAVSNANSLRARGLAGGGRNTGVQSVIDGGIGRRARASPVSLKRVFVGQSPTATMMTAQTPPTQSPHRV